MSLLNSISDAWNDAKNTISTNMNNASSAMNTWSGGAGGKWNPLNSALFTGKGMPWSANNQTNSDAYWKAPLGALTSAFTGALAGGTKGGIPGAIIGGVLGEGAGIATSGMFDTGGSQRKADQDAASQRQGAQEQAQGATDRAQASTDAQNAQIANTAQANTGAANSLEQSLMSKYLGQQNKGKNLYGGY